MVFLHLKDHSSGKVMSDMLHGDLSSRYLPFLHLLLTGRWVEEDREVGAVELAVHLDGIRCLCVHMCSCVCVHVCAFMYERSCVCSCVCVLYVCMRVYKCVCACVC